MRVGTYILGKIFMDILLIMMFTPCFTLSIAQDSSNGTIYFIFKPANNITQFALWLEKENGEYMETSYLTNFIGRRGGGNRTADPDIDLSTGNRLSALPVWCHKRGVVDTTFGIENYYPPAEAYASYPADIDAISSATPGTNLQGKSLRLNNLPYGIYHCWIEANKSFDQNDDHDYSYYRGQPSVVWQVAIDVSAVPDSSQVPGYAGYGSPDGSDGNIHVPDATITSAVNLLSDLGGYRFKVVYSPEAVNMEDDAGYSTPAHAFMLNQNYPNPFNPVTNIDFNLPKKSRISLAIYNASGQKVVTLFNGIKQGGQHTLSWDATGYSSGIYFIKMEAGEFSVIRKCVLVK